MTGGGDDEGVDIAADGASAPVLAPGDNGGLGGVVSSGGKIADYLSDEDKAVSNILDQLSPDKPEETEKPEETAEEKVEQENEAVAAALSDTAPEKPEKAEEPEEKPDDDLSAADEKLNDLLSDRLGK